MGTNENEWENEEVTWDVTLLVNNKSAIQVAKHPEHQSTMKHVHRAYHWIRDQVMYKQITVSHVPGDENPADIFTKPLGRLKFTKFRSMLRLTLGQEGHRLGGRP